MARQFQNRYFTIHFNVDIYYREIKKLNIL